MILVYDYLSAQHFYQSEALSAQAYYLVMATDEEGDISTSSMASIYQQIFQVSPAVQGMAFGPFLDKGQLAMFAQGLARELGAEKAVLHSASDWNRLMEKVRDPKELEVALFQGEVFQGVEQTSSKGLFKRFFKDS